MCLCVCALKRWLCCLLIYSIDDVSGDVIIYSITMFHLLFQTKTHALDVLDSTASVIKLNGN